MLNGIRTHWRISGAGEPIFLLHGFTGSSANWSQVVSRLDGRYQVIAPDLLGHGETESPPDPRRYRIENAAQDLIALWQSLALPPAHWLGYSMGGRLALYLALAYPAAIKTLILESASPGLTDAAARADRVRSDEALAARIERDGIAPFVAAWESLPLFESQTEAQRASLRDARLRNNPAELANSLRGMGTGAQPSLWDRLPELAAPVLVIAGEHDAKFTAIAQQMAAAIPQARLTVIPGAGHTTHLEQPDLFVAAIHEHLDG